jgi:hypothetical protein
LHRLQEAKSVRAATTASRVGSRQISVNGKTYPSVAAYLRVLARRHGVRQLTLAQKLKRGVSLEELSARARADAQQRDPERFRYQRRGEVEAYGWRWPSRSAFCTYYFGYSSPAMRIERTIDEARLPMTWGKAALEYILRLFDIGELGADCRWSPEREATMRRGCLPLNARDERLPDELNMAAFHAGIQRAHARQRAMGEEARRESAARERAQSA